MRVQQTSNDLLAIRKGGVRKSSGVEGTADPSAEVDAARRPRPELADIPALDLAACAPRAVADAGAGWMPLRCAAGRGPAPSQTAAFQADVASTRCAAEEKMSGVVDDALDA
jgi:hypothetical protein